MSKRLILVSLCAAGLGAFLAGCGGLAGEPRIVASLPPATDVPTLEPYPVSLPDVALGAQVFATNCTRCHGADGKGTGELVQNGQLAKLADFTDRATTIDQTPADFFATITNGKIENLMPPWGDALSAEERWAAAMYTYTLPFSQEQIARGADLYATHCADCALDAPEQTVSLNGLELDARINSIPALAALNDTERVDVAAYLRSLSVTNASAIGTIAQPEATTEVPIATEDANATETVLPESVTVTGTVSNGTAAGSIPDDLPIILYTFDADFNQQQVSGSANADGNFSFPDVVFDVDSTYAVTTTYRSQVFASDLLSGDALRTEAADGTLSLPITIYELTEDPAVIRIDGLVTQVSVQGDSLQIVQAFNILNTGDRAFTSNQTASNGATISLVIQLPPGAVVVGFPENQNRYITDADTFTIFDTFPVLPAEQHIVQVVYIIPYDSGGAIIEQPLTYALDGPVRLLMTPLTMGVKSDQLQPRGTETVGDSQYQGYGADLTLAAGEVLRYELTGASAPVSTAPVVSSDSLLPIVLIVLGIAALLGGGLVMLGTRNRSGDQQVIDILVRQIAELDAEHEAGRIDDDSHERQRAALKARLTALMERKK
jgi:mono/diheme cytochrome c family protein